MPAPADACATLVIDLDRLAANWRTLDGLTGAAETAAVVKADAYGVGIARAVPALRQAGARTFFTAHPDEGVAARTAAPDAVVYVLNGPRSGPPEVFLDHDLVPVLNDLGDIERWQLLARRLGRRLPVAVHLDTGMTRLGLLGPAVATLAAEPGRLDGLEVRLWLTHPACADEPGHPMNPEQRDRFRGHIATLPAAPASFCNSPAIHLGPAYHFDVVRPGVALYGSNPSAAATVRMEEVVHLKAKILQIHHVDTPRTVGYGAEHPIERPTRIATVGVGYGDGYLRALGGKAHGAIGGLRAPSAGRISMDLTTFDVSGIPEDAAHPGAEISLIGGGVDIDELAAAGGTIAYELLTGLSRRYARRYVGTGRG